MHEPPTPPDTQLCSPSAMPPLKLTLPLLFACLQEEHRAELKALRTKEGEGEAGG